MAMMTADFGKRILQAVLDSYPENAAITSLKIQEGWGDTIQVEMLMEPDRPLPRPDVADMKNQLRSAIEHAAPGDRLIVKVIDRS